MSGLDNGPAVLFFKIFGYSFYCFFFPRRWEMADIFFFSNVVWLGIFFRTPVVKENRYLCFRKWPPECTAQKKLGNSRIFFLLLGMLIYPRRKNKTIQKKNSLDY